MFGDQLKIRYHVAAFLDKQFAPADDATSELYLMADKQEAIARGQTLASKYPYVAVMDYMHPDLKGVEIALRIWHSDRTEE